MSHLTFFHQACYPWSQDSSFFSFSLQSLYTSSFGFWPSVSNAIHSCPPRSCFPYPLSLSLVPFPLPFFSFPQSFFTPLPVPFTPHLPRLFAWIVCGIMRSLSFSVSVSGNITLRSVDKWPGAIGVTLAPPLPALPTSLFCIKGSFIVQKQKEKSR